MTSVVLGAFVAAQIVAATVLVRRLLPGRRRAPPVDPAEARAADAGAVSVLIPTRDEAARIGPCLVGLAQQSATMREALFIDSQSTDGTTMLIARAAAADPRFRLTSDAPLPGGWVGKVWALAHGVGETTGPWVLGIDADTEPRAGMIDAVLAAAREYHLDAVSFAPTFAGQTAAERWLQPALLATLVYRFGAPGTPARSDRLLGNGQCFLVRREVLVRAGGFAGVRRSFADDVSLARQLAITGARVAFLDGARVLGVRSYRSVGEMWREWGRSIDAKDAATPLAHWFDVLYLALVFAAPLPMVIVAAAHAARGLFAAALLVNLAVLALRLRLQAALASSYERRGPTFWLAPLADPLAFARIVLSSVRRPSEWRGRRYATTSSDHDTAF